MKLVEMIRTRGLQIFLINVVLLFGLFSEFDWPEKSPDHYDMVSDAHDFQGKSIDSEMLEDLYRSYESFLVADVNDRSDGSDTEDERDRAPFLTLGEQVGEVEKLQLPEGAAVLKAVVSDEAQHYAILLLENDGQFTDIKVVDQGEFFGLVMTLISNTKVSFSHPDLNDNIVLRLYE